VVNESDSYVYCKSNEHGVVIICLYVDDMLIFETSIKVIKLTKDFLNSTFDLKDLAEDDLILRVKVKKSESSFSLNHFDSSVHFDLDP